MARMLSVWSPTWPVATWRRRNPCVAPGEPHPTPFALLITERGVRRLHAIDAGAAALGLYPGQKATDAGALCPELAAAEADLAGDQEALLALADWCVRFSPAVAVDTPDGLMLDISGVSHLWGGERAMLDDLLARLAANGVPARGSIADTAGAAWALARYGPDRTIAPVGGHPPLLEGLPIAGLRLDATAAAQLPRLGLTRIGRIMGLPRGQLARRFGAHVMLRLDQALGQADEALTYRRPPSPWFDRVAFAEPISVLDDLVRAAGDVAEKLCARMALEGQGARRFLFTYHRLDGMAPAQEVRLSLAGRDTRRLVKLLAPKLEAIDPGFGIEVVTLTAHEVEPLSDRQGQLEGDRAAAREETLAPLVDRLTNRLGEGRVWRAEPRASHVPEQAVAARPALSVVGGTGWDPDRPRPLRLFRRPEPITVIAKLPDDPPRTFTWRGRPHRVSRAEGPERIAEEWWGRPIGEVTPAALRDYYRVEDEAGGRYWLFREGLYSDGEPLPRWWLHGLFA
jgi:protein ImuB